MTSQAYKFVLERFRTRSARGTIKSAGLAKYQAKNQRTSSRSVRAAKYQPAQAKYGEFKKY